jgi:hypothetical protein
LIETSIKQKAKYRPGRPKNGEPSVPESFEFHLEIKIIENEEKLKKSFFSMEASQLTAGSFDSIMVTKVINALF